MSYKCQSCDEQHEGLPMSYVTDRPALWDDSYAEDGVSKLQPDLCVIKDEQFFVRGRVVIPIVDGPPGAEFDWTIWASLSRTSFSRTVTLWSTPGREKEAPYFGWFATELPLYGLPTMNLKTHVCTSPVGQRPRIVLEPSDHPLSVEQRTGMTMERVQRIAERMLHPAG
jgi:hypothetical protein